MANKEEMVLIAGPCVIESRECLHQVAKTLCDITEKLGITYYFKASFDKANRTSVKSFRGPGIKKGLSALQEIKDTYGVKIATDIHEPWQAEPAAKVVDLLQIPAFLCRQTDLLLAAAKTGKPVNVKKAQFLAPWDMKNVVDKLMAGGAEEIILCERGSSFGYNRLVVDMAGISEMKNLGVPVIFDATHSVQCPGGNGDSTGGNRQYVEPLARAAIAAGADGIFMEIHPDPDHALSDGPNMVALSDAERMISSLYKLWNFVGELQ